MSVNVGRWQALISFQNYTMNTICHFKSDSSSMLQCQTRRTPQITPVALYDKWREVQRRVIFCIEGRVLLYFPNSMCVVKSFPFHDLMILQKWARRQGRRGCSDEGEREGQELTSECVLARPSRSLEHKHCSFKYAQDRHMHRRA
jgi:hypothetical protein